MSYLGLGRPSVMVDNTNISPGSVTTSNITPGIVSNQVTNVGAGSTTLSYSQSGIIIINPTVAPVTLNIPAAISTSFDTTYTLIVLNNINQVTVNFLGGQKCDGVSTFTLQVGQNVQITSKNNVGWTFSNYSGVAQGNKNLVINGNLDYWQRGTSTNIPSNAAAYLADRWAVTTGVGITATVTQQVFGVQSVVPNNPYYFQRVLITTTPGSLTFNTITRLENIQRFSGKTITISFWAKSDTARTLDINVDYNFGSGGSATLNNYIVSVNTDTNWVKCVATVSIPNLNSYTLGTGSYLGIRFNVIAAVVNQFLDIAQVQVEEGPIATPFERKDTTFEFNQCRRYFQDWSGVVLAANQAAANAGIKLLPVAMRSTPAITQTTPTGTGATWACTAGYLYQGGVHSIDATTTVLKLDAELY